MAFAGVPGDWVCEHCKARHLEFRDANFHDDRCPLNPRRIPDAASREESYQGSERKVQRDGDNPRPALARSGGSCGGDNAKTIGDLLEAALVRESSCFEQPASSTPSLKEQLESNIRSYLRLWIECALEEGVSIKIINKAIDLERSLT